MESAFSRLFRTSKLASFDRSIKQVYATYPEAIAYGDWGLKRNIPAKVKTRLVTIGSLDTKEQITQLESANKQYMTINAWKENFPASRSPTTTASEDLSMFTSRLDIPARHAREGESELAGTRGPPRNVGTMSRSEWRQFLEEARSRRAEWKHTLEDGLYAPEEHMAFMNATNIYMSQGDGVHRSPTYHDYVPVSEELQVQGRVLNRTAAGFAVAVQGIIAYLPSQNYSSEVGFQYRDVKTFYVHSATFDSQGRPEVHLGLRPRGSQEPMRTFDTGSRSSFAYSQIHGGKVGANRKELENIRNMMRLNKILTDGQGSTDDGANSSALEGALDRPSKESDAVSDAFDLLDKTRR